jgi:toxin FitB
VSYLLDTCILSISRKFNHSRSDKLRYWLRQHRETSYFISAISIGEIQTGISKLKQDNLEKKKAFETWLISDVIPSFEHRILGIDLHTCFLWGQIRGEAQKRGYVLPPIDALIAASAIQHQLTLVTENTKDFLFTGVSLFNPFSTSSSQEM